MRLIFAIILVSISSWTITLAQQDSVFISTDVPRGIPDGPAGIAESNLSIGINRQILDLNVVVSITHPFVGDLGLYLYGPGPEIVRLAYRCGFSGDNYTNTRFDDEATTVICNGTPPFTGSFVPDQPLYEFDGLGTGGTWTFHVTDFAAGDIGSITAWRLEISMGDIIPVDPGQTPTPQTFDFFGCYPNPFNAETVFRFTLSQPGQITLDLVDLLGRHTETIVKQHLQPGEYNIPYNASNLTGGIYFACLNSGSASQTRKVILLK